MQTSQTSFNTSAAKRPATPAKIIRAKQWPFLAVSQPTTEGSLMANARRVISTTAAQLEKR